MENLYCYLAKIVRVVDGDTVDATIDLGFDVCVNVRLRLYGLDTPEVYGVKKESQEYLRGVEATNFVLDWLSTYKNEVLVKTYVNQNDKYGRWLVEIKTVDGSRCLNEELLNSGHAKVYGD